LQHDERIEIEPAQGEDKATFVVAVSGEVLRWNEFGEVDFR
jgi:hypothetical protein